MFELLEMYGQNQGIMRQIAENHSTCWNWLLTAGVKWLEAEVASPTAAFDV